MGPGAKTAIVMVVVPLAAVIGGAVVGVITGALAGEKVGAFTFFVAATGAQIYGTYAVIKSS